MIVAFSGKIGSGKTTLTTELATLLEWPRVSFGEYVRSYAIQHQTEPTRENLQYIGERLLSENAEQFCTSVLNQAKWQTNNNLIIDGVRHTNVLALIKKLVEPLTLVHVHIDAEEKTRLDRLQLRYSVFDIQQLDSHSTELDVKDKLRQQADLVIQSETAVELLVQQILNWLRKPPFSYDN